MRDGVLGSSQTPSSRPRGPATSWSGYFDLLHGRLQIELINPVQTKVQRFADSRAALGVIRQPRSTIDPEDWLRSGPIVVVNTASGTVGEDTAALAGGTLINLVLCYS